MLSILNFSIAGPSVWKDPSTFLFNGCHTKQMNQEQKGADATTAGQAASERR